MPLSNIFKNFSFPFWVSESSLFIFPNPINELWVVIPVFNILLRTSFTFSQPTISHLAVFVKLFQIFDPLTLETFFLHLSILSYFRMGVKK